MSVHDSCEEGWPRTHVSVQSRSSSERKEEVEVSDHSPQGHYGPYVI